MGTTTQQQMIGGLEKCWRTDETLTYQMRIYIYICSMSETAKKGTNSSKNESGCKRHQAIRME